VTLRGNDSTPRLALRLARAALAAVLVTLAGSSGAAAADSIYWSTGTSAEIRMGNLDGFGAPQTLFAGTGLRGVAIDAATGKIYWPDQGDETIRVGNLDGTGSAQTLFTEPPGSSPSGVAIDPAAGRIYWADASTQTIRVGNLDGSGTPQTLFTESGGNPAGVAIDPAGGRIYWANAVGGELRVANLDGSGTAQTLFTDAAPNGVAIDPAGGRIYWASQDGPIRVANLDGTGTPQTLFDESGAQPIGVAIDPVADRIYWANFAADTIRAGNLDGSGAAQTLFPEPPVSGPNFVALLRSPAALAAPQISGGGALGEELSCSDGQWAPDLLGAFLFRAPASFAYQWARDGSDVPGATGPTFTPTAGGSYSCRVTATNQAGSATQTSEPVGVSELELAAGKRKVRRGKRVMLSGEIVAGSVACEAGRTVALQRRRPSDESFTTFAHATTDAGGSFSLRVTVKQPPRLYMSKVASTQECGGTSSSVERVRKKRR
jgi:DNA-binding beta-propeller fold protein YncE